MLENNYPFYKSRRNFLSIYSRSIGYFKVSKPYHVFNHVSLGQRYFEKHDRALPEFRDDLNEDENSTGVFESSAVEASGKFTNYIFFN